MLVPLIFIVAMVVRATHSLKAELVNGTATITIEDFDKAYESSRSMRSGERKEVGDTYAIGLEDPSLDTESLIRSVLEQLCPYVGYYPVKETIDKAVPITVKDTSESKYHADDETTRTTLSDKYSSSTYTTEKNLEVLVNNSSEITSTTEYIAKTTNKTDEVIADIKIDPHTYHNVTYSTLKTEIETTFSTPKDKNDSTVYAKPEKVLVNTSTTEYFTEKSINTKNYTEITKTLVHSSSKGTEYNSSFKEIEKELVLIDVKDNLTTSSTVVPITETTETTSIETILKHDRLLEEVINSTIVSMITESVAPQVSSESTISIMKYKLEGPSIKEHITNTTPVEKNISKSDIYEEKLSTEGNEIESTSTELPTKKLFKEDILPSTLLTSKSANIAITEENLESEKSTEATELFVHAYNNVSYTSDDISRENKSYEVNNYNDHTNDELIVAVVVTESTSPKFDDDYILYSTETAIETISTEGELAPSPFEKENVDVPKKKLEEKIIYEHDLHAVDKRRYIVVIVFGTILLVFSLAWAIKVIINRHKESYELPQEENNDMELGNNSNDNSTK